MPSYNPPNTVYQSWYCACCTGLSSLFCNLGSKSTGGCIYIRNGVLRSLFRAGSILYFLRPSCHSIRTQTKIDDERLATISFACLHGSFYSFVMK